MPKRDFNQKNILITGAAGHLGTALCEVFLKTGARILALDLQEERLKALDTHLKPLGGLTFCHACDSSDSEALLAALYAAQQHGPIDLLINNAGITHIERLQDMEAPIARLRKVMEINLFAAAICANELLPELLEQKGMIINISSVAGFAPLLGRTAYAASKHAMHGFFESLRSEVIEQGVQCMMVCPSFIGPNPAVANFGKMTESIHQDKKVLGNLASPNDIAAKILRAAQRNRPRLVVGKAGRISWLLRRYFPNRYEAIMRKRLSKEL